MSNFSSRSRSRSPSPSPPSVPSINILKDDGSALFEQWVGMYNGVYGPPEDTNGMYPYPQGLQQDFLPTHPSPDLDEMVEFSHLTIPGQSFLTDAAYSTPYYENRPMPPLDAGLSPSSLDSSIHSPSSSFGDSLSPSSFYDSSALSDSESLLSPATSDGELWSTTYSFDHPSFDSTGAPTSLTPQSMPHRTRSQPAPRRGRVASKAMLEANGRRRRHAAQYQCFDCKQTFTAQFSLKRHAQSHTGERPYPCTIPGCRQRFYNSSDCKRHERSKKRHKNL